MKIKRPLAPAFINRFDRYLLLNKPEVWSARTHLVLYYGFLFIAALAVLAFLVPDDPRKNTPAPYWIGFVSLIAFVALIGWLIYLLRFNVFKRYGITSAANRLLTFILYFIAIGTFVLFCYVEPYVETVRANAAYTDKEIVADIDKTNLGICQLEYDSLNHTWSSDTVLVVAKIPVAESNATDEGDMPDTVVLVPHAPRIRIDKEALQNRLATADSVQKINDSLYVFSDCPTYTLLQTNRTYPEVSVQPLKSLAIFHQVIKNYTPPKDRQQIRAALKAIRQKYQWQANYPESYNDYSDRTNRMAMRYGLSYISSSINNILERKHRWSPAFLPIYIRIFIYNTLVLTLLLFAFRHSTAKTFFLSILTAVIISILTSLIMAFSEYSASAFFKWVLFYFVLFFAVSFTAYTIKTRNVFTGIAINLFLWLLPFIPLCIVANHYAGLRANPDYDYQYDYTLEQQHLFWAEIGGLILLLVIIATYIHNVYRKWYAAPEQ